MIKRLMDVTFLSRGSKSCERSTAVGASTADGPCSGQSVGTAVDATGG
jgi:hypothetical protein